MKRSREPEEAEAAAESPAFQGGEVASPSTSYPTLPTASKIPQLDEWAVDDTSPLSTATMRCSLPGHKGPLVFKSYTEYETHYAKVHSNRCTECRKNFPSEHLLNIHIEECHDAFAAVLRDKGEHTYSCFVEGCERKCMTPQKRRMHLIDKHMYPKNYFFAVTKEGIDGRSSLLLEGGHHRRKSSASQPNGKYAGSKQHSLKPAEASRAADSSEQQSTISSAGIGGDAGAATDETKPDVDMADLTSAMSSLQFVPASVQFGRGGRKTGFARTS
ncbi:hypothetical protein BX600DRAFT_456263 [Xylariales sp. PMI_506]|nr:hypothetical protein BX600DRAFT_456263 [Xylariales sp. PMI_506]